MSHDLISVKVAEGFQRDQVLEVQAFLPRAGVSLGEKSPRNQ
jgi:hypothetical protein